MDDFDIRIVNKHRERNINGVLVKILRNNLSGFVMERFEDKVTSGIPDMAVTGNKITSRWEVKLATPKFKTKGIQELTMLRLAKAGYAWYIIYYEWQGVKRTYIVSPKDIGNDIQTWTDFAEGFNHEWVLERVKQVHGYHN